MTKVPPWQGQLQITDAAWFRPVYGQVVLGLIFTPCIWYNNEEFSQIHMILRGPGEGDV